MYAHHTPTHHLSGFGQDEGQVEDIDVRRPPQTQDLQGSAERMCGEEAGMGRWGASICRGYKNWGFPELKAGDDMGVRKWGSWRPMGKGVCRFRF